jgi:sugar phosphate isomerase/epimerase
MKVGVFTNLFAGMGLADCLEYLSGMGVESVELSTGNYNGSPHCPLDELLESDSRCRQYKKMISDRGLEICALSCHGNVLHPDSDKRNRFVKVQHQTIRLAEKLGVQTVNTFSGCPGDSKSAKFSNWVCFPWPDENQELLKWQWEEEVIPFWREEVKFAQNHGVQIGLEMFAGFVVYNAETLLKLRSAVGPTVGADLDPSHVIWQGVDPAIMVAELDDAVFHVQMKDVKLHPPIVARHGVIDAKPFGDEAHRAWTFRTVGYGHDVAFWKEFVSALRRVGYDGALCIEQEDSLLSAKEGFEKSLTLVKELVVRDPERSQWWPPTQSV